jgi:hypothetical protein
MMGNGLHANYYGDGTVDLKLTLGKIVQLNNVQHVSTINKNLVSGPFLCRDGFRAVLESNKFVVSKYGQFIGKGYECRGMFHFSVFDFCNKPINFIYDGLDENDAIISHSHLCHLNFDSMFQLSTMSLLSIVSIVKGSKCHSCLQSKQPQKTS